MTTERYTKVKGYYDMVKRKFIVDETGHLFGVLDNPANEIVYMSPNQFDCNNCIKRMKKDDTKKVKA